MSPYGYMYRIGYMDARGAEMKRKTVLLLGMFLCLVVTGMLAALIIMGAASSPPAYIALAVSASLGILLGINGCRENLRETRAQLENRDDFQDSYSRSFRIFPLSVMLLASTCALQLWNLWEHPEGYFRLIMSALTGTAAWISIWGYARMLSGATRTSRFRYLLQDEFFQDNLSKSRSDGFYTLLAGITLCFFAGLFSARLTVALLPFAAGSSVAFAGLRFAWRDGKAAAEE